VADALEALADLAGAPRLEVTGLPADVWGIAASTDAGIRALLANLRSTAVRLDVAGAGPVELAPLSFVRLQLAG
jgi:hypothetical protein